MVVIWLLLDISSGAMANRGALEGKELYLPYIYLAGYLMPRSANSPKVIVGSVLPSGTPLL